MNQHVRMFWKIFKANGFSLTVISSRSLCWLCESVLCTDRPYMLELVDDNGTIWFWGTAGGGGLTSFENWNPTAADCTRNGGIVLSLQDST
jgi:hypothetical protein